MIAELSMPERYAACQTLTYAAAFAPIRHTPAAMIFRYFSLFTAYAYRLIFALPDSFISPHC